MLTTIVILTIILINSTTSEALAEPPVHTRELLESVKCQVTIEKNGNEPITLESTMVDEESGRIDIKVRKTIGQIIDSPWVDYYVRISLRRFDDGRIEFGIAPYDDDDDGEFRPVTTAVIRAGEKIELSFSQKSGFFKGVNKLSCE